MEDMSWYESVVDFGSSVFEYIGKHEWAANFVAGAATGAGQYLLQKDQQKHERDLIREKQRFEVDVNKINPASGGVNIAAYSNGLIGGSMTNGAIAQKKVK